MKETDERGHFLQVFCKISRFVEDAQKRRPGGRQLSHPGRCLLYHVHLGSPLGELAAKQTERALQRRCLLFQLGNEGGELFGAFLLGLDHVLRGLGQEAGVLELVVELI